MAKFAKVPRSESDTIIRLADRLADDPKFADAVAAHKSGDEAKLKSTLEKYGFKVSKVTIEPKQSRIGICVCAGFVCICVEVEV